MKKIIFILLVFASLNIKAQTSMLFIENQCVSPIKYGVWDESGKLIKTIKINAGQTKQCNLPVDKWYYIECIDKAKINKNINGKKVPPDTDYIPSMYTEKGLVFFLKNGYYEKMTYHCDIDKA